jgi:hypothetical protein
MHANGDNAGKKNSEHSYQKDKIEKSVLNVMLLSEQTSDQFVFF